MNDLYITVNIIKKHIKKFSENELDNIIKKHNINGEVYYKKIALDSYCEGFMKGVDTVIETLRRRNKTR